MSTTEVRKYEEYDESQEKSLTVVNTGSIEFMSTTEMKMKPAESFSCSSIEVLFSCLDDDRTNEKADMIQLNQKLAELAGKLHLMESETVFVEIIANIKDFAKLFETLVAGERTEIERLKEKIKTIEADKSRVSENLAVLKLEKEELMRIVEQHTKNVEKISKDIFLLRDENQKLKVECATLTERRQAAERRVISIQEELQYARETIVMKDREIAKIIGGKSGISILVSWETRLQAAITSIKKQYEEQLKAIQILYQMRMTAELNEWQIKLKKAIGESGSRIFEELELYRKEIFYLKEQLESKTAYIESMQISHEKYRKWSEEKLREFESNLSLVSSCIRKHNQTDFSLKSEIDNYRFYLEEAETRIAGIKTFFATVRLQTGSSTSIEYEEVCIEDKSDRPSIPGVIGGEVIEDRKPRKRHEESDEDEEVECN